MEWISINPIKRYLITTFSFIIMDLVLSFCPILHHSIYLGGRRIQYFWVVAITHLNSLILPNILNIFNYGQKPPEKILIRTLLLFLFIPPRIKSYRKKTKQNKSFWVKCCKIKSENKTFIFEIKLISISIKCLCFYWRIFCNTQHNYGFVPWGAIAWEKLLSAKYPKRENILWQKHPNRKISK